MSVLADQEMVKFLNGLKKIPLYKLQHSDCSLRADSARKEDPVSFLKGASLEKCGKDREDAALLAEGRPSWLRENLCILGKE